VSLATAQKDRDPAPVERLIDDNAHSLFTADPTTRFPALEVGRHGFTRPTYRAHPYRAHPTMAAAQRLRAKMHQEASATRKCTTDANVVMKGELSLRTP
jgi:hypothetical protein